MLFLKKCKFHSEKENGDAVMNYTSQGPVRSHGEGNYILIRFSSLRPHDSTYSVSPFHLSLQLIISLSNSQVGKAAKGNGWSQRAERAGW